MNDQPALRGEREEPFVIGGTGHRVLAANERSLTDRITSVLHTIIAEHPANSLSLRCSVAEGADRLLIKGALNLGLPWDSVLPCSPSCFREDFTTQQSRDQFDTLLAVARTVTCPDPQIDKETGYLWANDDILHSADVLVAIWNGEPGKGAAGTAETIARARLNGTPVIWISTHSPYNVRSLVPTG